MKRAIFLLLLIVFCCAPTLTKALDTSATSAILMDTDNNRILYAKNIHNVRSVASISKIMTAIVAIESADVKSKVTIGDEITKAYGSGIYIQVGEVLTLEDLLYGLMLRSGNDASLAIAKYVGGSVENFVEMMNKTAEKIGMKNTTFRNPNGLDEEDGGNLSSAYDMAILTSYAMKNDTYKKIVSTKKYTLKTNKNTYSWTNKNKLLRTYKYTTGGKTGFTEIARRTLVSTASKDGISLVAVTLNDGDDFHDHMNMFDYGFDNYKNYQILKAGNINIYDEKFYTKYNLYIKNDFNYLLANGEDSSVNLKFELIKDRNIENGACVGKVKVLLGDKNVHEENIYVKKKNVKKVSFFTKLKEWLND